MNPENIIAHFGGLTETAKALGVSAQAVHGWRKRGAVPALRIFQLAELLRDQAEWFTLQEEKMLARTLPGIVGRRPKLTREQLAEVREVCGSGRYAKHGTVKQLAQKYGCCVKVITRARRQGYMVYAREDKMKSALCAS